MDWSLCDDVERVPGKVSGAWIIKGTRVQADAILENAEAGCSAEEIGTNLFPGVGVDRVRRLMTFSKYNAAVQADAEAVVMVALPHPAAPGRR